MPQFSPLRRAYPPTRSKASLSLFAECTRNAVGEDDAARELVRLRDNWLNPSDISEDDLKKRTLTNLYNARPEWLANAHRTLDNAVFAAYGWPIDLTDQEILARLLALNHERAATQNTFPAD